MTGSKLRDALDALDWSPQQFAARFGLNRSTLNRWLNNQRAVPPWVPPVLLMLKAEERRRPRKRAAREGAAP
jgi:transcriptional regulator with XRE-family HTH domain